MLNGGRRIPPRPYPHLPLMLHHRPIRPIAFDWSLSEPAHERKSHHALCPFAN